jgi:hypothetical protein
MCWLWPQLYLQITYTSHVAVYFNVPSTFSGNYAFKPSHTSRSLPVKRPQNAEDGGSMLLRNVDAQPKCYMTQEHRRSPSIQNIFRLFMLVSWVVTPCGLICRYQYFWGIYCLHLHAWSWYIPTSPHGVATHMTSINVLNAVGTSSHKIYILTSNASYQGDSI